MAVGRIKVPKDAINQTSINDTTWYTAGFDENNNSVSIKVIDGRVFNNDANSNEYGTEIFDFEEYDYGGGGDSSNKPSVTSSSIKKLDFSHALEVCQNAEKCSGFSDSLNGVDVATINSMIKDSVNAAGYGTRDAVIAAAYALAADFPEITGFKYFYTLPSQDTTHNGMAQQEGLSETTYLDCRAFIQWVVHNAGFDASGLESMGHMDQAVGTLPGVTEISDIRQVQAGDIISTDYVEGRKNHTWLVVDVTEDGYYAAEEYGGAEIKFYSFDDPFGEYNYPDTTIYNMQDFYNNPSNVR